MNAEDIIVSVLLGLVGGLLIFTAIVASRRGKPFSWFPPRLPSDAPDDDPRHLSSAPATSFEPSGLRPFAALLKLDRLYALAGRLVLVAMVLYGVWVAPRLRWVLLGAVTALVLLFVAWHYVSCWLGGRSRA